MAAIATAESPTVATRHAHNSTSARLWMRSLELSDDQEFCHTNLAWLALPADPSKAATHFKRSAQINPGQRGVYFRLALAMECLSRPTFATLSLLENENFRAVEPEVATCL